MIEYRNFSEINNRRRCEETETTKRWSRSRQEKTKQIENEKKIKTWSRKAEKESKVRGAPLLVPFCYRRYTR